MNLSKSDTFSVQRRQLGAGAQLRLDKLDRRLIAELDRNAREPYSRLARKLRVPPETVRYRHASLLDRGVISSSFSVIDPGKLDSEVHKVLLKLHNVDESQVEKIIGYLMQSRSINWIARFDGLFDLGFTIWVRRIVELSQFADELRAKYHRFINKISFAVNIEAEFFPRSPGEKGKRRREQHAKYTTLSSSYPADALDLTILRALSVNPRCAATDIASRARVASETVHARIRKLELNQVITGYRLVIDSARLGQVNYYVVVYLRSASNQRIRQFTTYCAEHPCITYLIKALGEWDYELNVEVENAAEYRELMMELNREFSDIIREYSTMLVSQIHKFSILPVGIELSGSAD